MTTLNDNDEWDYFFNAWAEEKEIPDPFAEGVNDKFNEDYDNGWRPGLGGRPRIDEITATYFRKGKCSVCTGSVERTRSFTDTTLSGCQVQADAWTQTPLQHKRCE